MISKHIEWIATAGNIGHIPKMPGTMGSIPGLFLALGTHFVLKEYCHLEGPLFYLASTFVGVLICLLGAYSIKEIEKTWQHDDSRIVIDEVAGQYFSTVFFPVGFLNALLSFVLFRFFDIVKPWPISRIDKSWHHSLATLVDDLFASFFAIAALLLIQYL